MPDRSKLGQKAIKMIALREEMSNIEERIEGLRMELIELFVKESKTSIRVEGHVVSYSHVENDKIIIKHEAKGKKDNG